MNVLRGYIYDSTNPYMPIIAAVFDEQDNVIATKVVENAAQGAQFIGDAIAACDSVTEACTMIATVSPMARPTRQSASKPYSAKADEMSQIAPLMRGRA
jgi:hypothetical protein